MSAIQPTKPSGGIWYYLNPTRIFKNLSDLFKAIMTPDLPSTADLAERHITVIDREDDFVGIERNFYDWLARTSRGYPSTEITLADGSKLTVAKTFLTDIERLGQPDRFILNGEEVQNAPRTDEQKQALLQNLVNIADGNQRNIREWTEIWSYRPKIALISHIMEVFNDQYKLNPVFGRTSFKEVVISLDTRTSLLTCIVKGEVLHGTDDNLDTHKVDVKYEASMVYNMQEESVENSVTFG